MHWGAIMFLFIFILVLMLVVTAKQNRKHVAITDRKRCRSCGGQFAATANYCGRCGTAL